MTSQPALVKLKGPILDPGLCRCCRSIKKCRFLTSEYEWTGRKEIYSDMFMDCFGLLLSHLDGDSKECCICATCVSRLRDACAFRQQVLACEDVFLRSKLDIKDADLDADLEVDRKLEVKVKAEPCDPSDTPGDYTADHDSDNKPESDVPEVKVKKMPVKKELLTKMKKLRQKLDHRLDNQALKTIKKEKSLSKQRPNNNDRMIYSNTVTIVKNSYVCPFLNRISNYYCFYCKDQFTNPTELRDHTISHNPKDTFESSMENKKIPKIDITRIDCRLCEIKIDDLTTLKTHLADVHGKIIYPIENEFLKFKLTLNNLCCTECGSVFPYFDSLKKHMIDHFGTFVCDMCGACFLEATSLRTHIKSHNKVEASFPCEVCGKNLKSKYSRYLHIATIHEKKPTVNCYKCEASFLSHALRNKHLIEVHGDNRTFPCKLCDKVYNRRKTLMEHNRRNHLKVFKHQCDLCDQKFYLPSRLKEHMATHTGERNFRCEYCEKTYPRLQSLQEHIRSHGDRKYKCDFCNSAFTQNGSLKNHMKSHQQGYDLETSFS
ncbi:transcription factor Ouib-like [Plodia interpunctella]|uniref:transcription factor Ouib-like n=1 Tax=Plodia interpunctella TaxID=58824 RepID=UPI0023684431|nr:transcription factor Ouib-like [Plodia interpunctella]